MLRDHDNCRDADGKGREHHSVRDSVAEEIDGGHGDEHGEEHPKGQHHPPGMKARGGEREQRRGNDLDERVCRRQVLAAMDAGTALA